VRQSSSAGGGTPIKRSQEEPAPEMGGLWYSMRQAPQVSRVQELSIPSAFACAKRAKVVADPAGASTSGSQPSLNRAPTLASSGWKSVVVQACLSWSVSHSNSCTHMHIVHTLTFVADDTDIGHTNPGSWLRRRARSQVSV
jgi:hypothetical protein